MRITNGDTKKMQNELKTTTAGTVATVHVQEGAKLVRGALDLAVAFDDGRACNT